MKIIILLLFVCVGTLPNVNAKNANTEIVLNAEQIKSAQLERNNSELKKDVENIEAVFKEYLSNNPEFQTYEDRISHIAERVDDRIKYFWTSLLAFLGFIGLGGALYISKMIKIEVSNSIEATMALVKVNIAFHDGFQSYLTYRELESKNNGHLKTAIRHTKWALNILGEKPLQYKLPYRSTKKDRELFHAFLLHGKSNLVYYQSLLYQNLKTASEEAARKEAEAEEATETASKEAARKEAEAARKEAEAARKEAEKLEDERDTASRYIREVTDTIINNNKKLRRSLLIEKRFYWLESCYFSQYCFLEKEKEACENFVGMYEIDKTLPIDKKSMSEWKLRCDKQSTSWPFS